MPLRFCMCSALCDYTQISVEIVHIDHMVERYQPVLSEGTVMLTNYTTSVADITDVIAGVWKVIYKDGQAVTKLRKLIQALEASLQRCPK